MTKKQVSNADIFNSITAELPKEMQEQLGGIERSEISGSVGQQIIETMASYPTTKNAWIDTLTQKVSKSIIYSRNFSNPLKALHKGLLPYGSTIEQQFVAFAKKRGWYENFKDTGGSTENDLIAVEKPDIKVDYVSTNFWYKYKTSVSDSQLRDAFFNEGGLKSLTVAIVNSLENSVEYNEYLNTMKMITNETADTTGGSTIGKGLIQKVGDATNPNKAEMVKAIGNDPKEITKAIKKAVKHWSIPKSIYNLKSVLTHCPKSEIAILITMDMSVDIDVDLLASQFNMNKADIELNMVEVDDLGTVGGKTVHVVLCDKECLQMWSNERVNNSFYNPDRLTTNLFAHDKGIVGVCEFGNVLVITDK